MDNYKKTEQWLYKLNALKVYLEKLKQEYQELEELAEGTAIEYDKDKLCETYQFSSNTENMALELYKKQTKIKHTKHRIDTLEKALSILSDTEREIIEQRYFAKEPWFNITYHVQYEERHCRRIRRRAIETLSVALFGDKDAM